MMVKNRRPMKQGTDRRPHLTQKATIAEARTVYLSVDGDKPQETFIRIKGDDVTAELVCLHDLIARLISRMLQEGIALEAIGELLQGTRYEPAGVVQWDDRIKMCSSVMDYIGRHFLVHYCGRAELGHVTPAPAIVEKGKG